MWLINIYFEIWFITGILKVANMWYGDIYKEIRNNKNIDPSYALIIFICISW